MAFELPLTITSPKNLSNFVALSFLGLNSKRLGVVSISLVVAFPELNLSFCITFNRKGMFVLTPLILNSLNARRTLCKAMSKLGA